MIIFCVINLDFTHNILAKLAHETTTGSAHSVGAPLERMVIFFT